MRFICATCGKRHRHLDDVLACYYRHRTPELRRKKKR